MLANNKEKLNIDGCLWYFGGGKQQQQQHVLLFLAYYRMDDYIPVVSNADILILNLTNTLRTHMLLNVQRYGLSTNDSWKLEYTL